MWQATIYRMQSKSVSGPLYWNGQLVWTPALALYLCVGDRGLCPAGFIAHLRLYRHIRQAAIPVWGTGFIAHL